MRNHDLHCRKLKPRQHHHDVATALAFDDAFLAGQGPVADLQLQAETTRRKAFARLSWRIWVIFATFSQTIA